MDIFPDWLLDTYVSCILSFAMFIIKVCKGMNHIPITTIIRNRTLVTCNVLNWSEHVKNLCESLFKYFAIFNHIEYKVTPYVARQIYYAFIYSRIQYGIEVYNNCSETHTNRLQVIQNKLLKLILKLDGLTATNLLHKEMNVLKLTHIGESNVLGFVNKVVRGHCPEIFHSYFEIKINAYDVRTKGQLVTPQTRIQLGDRAVKVKGCLLWNRILKNMLKHIFPNHLRITLPGTIYLRTKETNSSKSVKWQWQVFSINYYFVPVAFFYPYLIIDSLFYFKDLICISTVYLYRPLCLIISRLTCSALGCLMNMWTFRPPARWAHGLLWWPRTASTNVVFF